MVAKPFVVTGDGDVASKLAPLRQCGDRIPGATSCRALKQPDWRLRVCFCRTRLSCVSDFPPTDRTKVKRKPDRGSYDRELIYGILDQAFVCTVGFIVDGLPCVVPTNYVRVGDKLFLHGSTASRLMRTLSSGAPFCLSVTLLDGIVFSPTATGHSVNYRSVVVMGKAA